MKVENGVSEPSLIHIPCLGYIRIKYVALLLLVVQTVGAIITLRMSRLGADPTGHKYVNTTAVFISEVFKLIGSLFLVCRDANYSISTTMHEINSFIIKRPLETFKVGVPALLYTIQNNLLFIALSNMSAALYQVTYQLKILTTAVLSVIMLKTRLSVTKTIALFILTAGVSCVQLAEEGPGISVVEGNNVMIGLVAVFCACLTSGFAGVYFEKILKNSHVSIWVRNVQLALFGSIIGLLGAYWYDGSIINAHGFFQGYTMVTWIVILFQSAGGLIVAAVLKYADNILKCFANSLAIIFSCIFSYFLMGDFSFTMYFVVGSTLVIFSTYCYGMDEKFPSFVATYFGLSSFRNSASMNLSSKRHDEEDRDSLVIDQNVCNPDIPQLDSSKV